jgi:hypothetical protein
MTLTTKYSKHRVRKKMTRVAKKISENKILLTLEFHYIWEARGNEKTRHVATKTRKKPGPWQKKKTPSTCPTKFFVTYKYNLVFIFFFEL